MNTSLARSPVECRFVGLLIDSIDRLLEDHSLNAIIDDHSCMRDNLLNADSLVDIDNALNLVEREISHSIDRWFTR